MARPTLLKNRKFARLASALSPFCAAGGDIAAHGALELLWATAYENANETIGDAFDVEIAARWRGPPGELVKALLEAGGDGRAGFIEPVPERAGWYRIHDFWDHAPDYVRRRAEREGEREARGQTLSEIRAEAGRKGALKRWGKESDGNRMASEKQVATTPAPAPSPQHPAPSTRPQPELQRFAERLGSMVRQDRKPLKLGGARVRDRFAQELAARNVEELLSWCLACAAESTTGEPESLAYFEGWLPNLPALRGRDRVA